VANTGVLTEKTFAGDAVAKQRAATSGATTMTLGGTILRAAVLVAIVLAGAAWGWTNAVKILGTNPWLYFAIWLGLIGLSLAMAVKPALSMVFGPVYSIVAGVWIGAISAAYNAAYEGVVAQAVLATLAVFIVTLLLYTLRIIRVSNRFVQIVVAATFGLLLLYLGFFIAGLFGVNLWAITGLGIAISAVAALLAAANLLIDFRFIEDGVKAQAPGYMMWFCAFGLVATLIWLYLELLRLLSLLRGD